MKCTFNLLLGALVVLATSTQCVLPEVANVSETHQPGSAEAGTQSASLNPGTNDGGPCGELAQACCSADAGCGTDLTCQTNTCQLSYTAAGVMRAAYSHLPPNTQTAKLEYLEFSEAAGVTEPTVLFSRPTIGSVLGSRDGLRWAFLANDSTAPSSPPVVWLIDNVRTNPAPTKVASSNPALPRTALFADSNLDYLVTCTDVETEGCGQLEVYRRAQNDYVTIARDVWSTVLSADSGLLTYISGDAKYIYWVDLTEAEPKPQLVFETSPPDWIPWTNDGMLARKGRTLCMFEAQVDESGRQANVWHVYAAQLGKTEAQALATVVGLAACYVQDDGSSVLVSATDVETQTSKLLLYNATDSGFDEGRVLYEKNAGQLDLSKQLFAPPVMSGYTQFFPYFGLPGTQGNGTVALTAYAADLTGSEALAMSAEFCEVLPSEHLMASPQVQASLALERAGSPLAWMHCNRQFGYVDMTQEHSFVAVDKPCADCFPATFLPVGDGLVYSWYTADSQLSPHRFVTARGEPLEVIPGSTELGDLSSLYVGQASAQPDFWRNVWHVNGSLSVTIPRDWEKKSTTSMGQHEMWAGPSVSGLERKPGAEGIQLTASTDTTESPEQRLSNLPARNGCLDPITADSGEYEVADGTSYRYSAERRTDCLGENVTHWFIALSNSAYSALLVYQDPTGDGEQRFYSMVDSIRIDPSHLPTDNLGPLTADATRLSAGASKPSAADAGAGSAP